MQFANLLDRLLVCALIEARSCERFKVLSEELPDGELAGFYRGLMASEARHFEHYIAFAKSECGVTDAEVERRLEELRKIEAALISEPDPDFRFHSGLPL